MEFDASTSAKTVSARAIWEPEFLSIVTAGATVVVDASSSPIQRDGYIQLMNINLNRSSSVLLCEPRLYIVSV